MFVNNQFDNSMNSNSRITNSQLLMFDKFNKISNIENGLAIN